MKNSYTIRGLKTINEYNMMQWVNDHFEADTVDVVFCDAHTAVITDVHGNAMRITTQNGVVQCCD